MRNPPAFQLYAATILADEQFKTLALGERGLFLTMMMQSWVNASSSIPRNPRDLAHILGLELCAVEQALTSRVLDYFTEENGRLSSQELIDQKTNLNERRACQSKGGKTGATTRWKKDNAVMATPLGKSSAKLMGSPKYSKAKQRTEKQSGMEMVDQDLHEYEAAFGGKQVAPIAVPAVEEKKEPSVVQPVAATPIDLKRRKPNWITNFT